MGNKAPRARVALLPRVIAFLLPRFLYPQRLLEPGVFSLGTLVTAFALTWSIFAVWNQYSIRKIENSFASVQLKDFRKATSDDEAVSEAINKQWADPKIKPWLREVMHAPSNAYTARQQAIALFEAPDLAGSPEEQDRLNRLAEAMTGQRVSVLPATVPAPLALGFWYELKAPNGTEAFEAQASLGQDHWNKTIETTNRPLAEEKRKFAQRYMIALAAQMNEPIREMRRLNGWVQWLTVFLTCAIVVSVFRRRLLILKLNVSAQRATVDAESSGAIKPEKIRPASSEIADLFNRTNGKLSHSATALDELTRLRQSADTAIYGLYSSLAAAIPALGFLGTVLGMAAGLVSADSLFSALDKQRVVGQITQGLGLAFDATFVSLICAPIAVILQAMVRVREQRMFTRWVGAVSEVKVQGVAAATPAEPQLGAVT